jgi:hypothetical protein
MRGRKRYGRVNVMEKGKCFEQEVGLLAGEEEEKRKKIVTMGKCCEACRRDKACTAWTWTETIKRCVHGTRKTVLKATADCVSGSF